jgi:hypothetical protein
MVVVGAVSAFAHGTTGLMDSISAAIGGAI